MNLNPGLASIFYWMCLKFKHGFESTSGQGISMHPASVSPACFRQHREFSLQLIAPFVDLQSPESKVIT